MSHCHALGQHYLAVLLAMCVCVLCKNGWPGSESNVFMLKPDIKNGLDESWNILWAAPPRETCKGPEGYLNATDVELLQNRNVQAVNNKPLYDLHPVQDSSELCLICDESPLTSRSRGRESSSSTLCNSEQSPLIPYSSRRTSN